uniref:Uncharacterized protein n=1 Tax=Chrysotila carterae TaxID=13221 RepID=A0A7S4BR58_CHRCT
MEATRLTGLLRVAFTEAGANWDLQEQQMAQQQCLDRRAKAQVEGGTASKAPLAWADMARGISESTPGYSAAAANYRKFLSAVNSAFGGEAAQDTLAHAASIAFRSLQVGAAELQAADDVTSAHGARRQLQAARRLLGGGVADGASDLIKEAALVFGSNGPSDEAIRRMLEAHTPLEAWLRQHRQQGRGANGRGGKENASRNARDATDDDVRPNRPGDAARLIGAATLARFGIGRAAAESSQAAHATHADLAAPNGRGGEGHGAQTVERNGEQDGGQDGGRQGGEDVGDDSGEEGVVAGLGDLSLGGEFDVETLRRACRAHLKAHSHRQRLGCCGAMDGSRGAATSISCGRAHIMK